MSVVRMDIVYIPIRQLSVVWVQSQRPYSERWSKQIAENFDPDQFDPIIVTKPNGEDVYHIIEGQHRRHALEMYAARCNSSGRGDTEQAPCRIVAEADPARAAEIWLGINSGRKAVKPIQGFKVAVVAGREPEVTIEKIVRQNGYVISSDKAADRLSAVQALKVVFNRHNKMILNNVLKTIRSMWGGDPEGVRSVMIRGFGIFLGEFGAHADPKRMAKISEKWSPYKLIQAADAYKQSTMDKSDEAVSALLLREYNKGLKEGQKLKRKE